MASVPWAEIHEKFQAALALSRVELHKNPEKEPYKSKYSARALLEEVKALLGPAPEDEEERLQADEGSGAGDHALGPPAEAVEAEGPGAQRAVRLALIEFHLGVNHIDTEELSAGEEHLVKCLRLLRRYRLSHGCVSLYIQAQVREARRGAERPGPGLARGRPWGSPAPVHPQLLCTPSSCAPPAPPPAAASPHRGLHTGCRCFSPNPDTIPSVKIKSKLNLNNESDPENILNSKQNA